MRATAALAYALVAIEPVLGASRRPALPRLPATHLPPQRRSYDMIATYQPETDILSASKIDLDLEEIVTDLDR